MEDQVKEMNEHNLAMEEMPSSEDTCHRVDQYMGQIMILIVMTMMKIMGMREGFIGLCVGRDN